MTATRAGAPEASVEGVEVSAYRIPTDAPEADGTLSWEQTTIVVVEAESDGRRGLGYTYADPATATLIRSGLAPVVLGADAMSPPAAWAKMIGETRNLGRPGVVSMAVSAVDLALWDLKARLLGLPLCALLGESAEDVPVYGSGGFTTYSRKRLEEQLSAWVEEGIGRVKMKVGSDPGDDERRVGWARSAIGPGAELFVDANGAYSRKQALELAQAFRDRFRVSWFEEPVSSDDLEGLRLLRDRCPAGVSIAAGEYGYDLGYFAAMLAAGAVDVLQADVTRCGGITELLRIDALCRAAHVPLSLHCAPAIHLHPAMALDSLEHLEYFHDHVRIEAMLFDGAPRPVHGRLCPDRRSPGNGLELDREAAEAWAA